MNAAPVKITALSVRDIRFPTSRQLDGSDAMNPDPDYSAAYVVLETDGAHQGHGLTFTIGRGNEIVVAAVNALRPLVVGRTLGSFTENMGAFWRHITGDSQLRWIGPEKGAIHLATAAVVNAVWDLWAKTEGKPVWQLLADLSPAEVVRCIDFRYITDALTPDEALAILECWAPTKGERITHLRAAVTNEIREKVHAKGQGTGPKEEVGEVLYMRGVVAAMLSIEGVRAAQERFGKGKVMTGEQARWGYENLNLTQAKLDALGFKGVMRPVSTSCQDHMGSAWARIHTWDGSKWAFSSDWLQADDQIIRPMVKSAADKYAAEKKLTRRTGADCQS